MGVMTTFDQLKQPAIALTTRCVLLDQSEYERMQRIEFRARMKADQLRGMPESGARNEYIRALEFVLGEELLRATTAPETKE